MNASYILPWNHSFELDEMPRCRENETIIAIIHGYTETSDEPWISSLRRSFLRRSLPNQVTVVAVDWRFAARGDTRSQLFNYVQAASNVAMMGRVSAEFFARLLKSCSLNERSLHLVGHSLGAQVVGKLASWIHKVHGIIPEKVTALDPAVVLFPRTHPNRQDTHFLLALHTSARPSVLATAAGAVGVFEAFGDVDLYPNGGVILQPACRGNNTFFCSHRRAYIYYTDMVAHCNDQCDFSGELCETPTQAQRGTCNQGRINGVCTFINRQADNLLNENQHADVQRSSSIIYFTTNMDNLKIRCNRRSNEQGRG